MRNYRFRPPRDAIQNKSTVRHRRARIRALAILATVVVAGSGLLNLLSLMGGPSPAEQPRWLRVLFPLDFTHIHRTATLLLGFAVVLTAIHLAGLKKRALHFAIALSLASGFFNLTREWSIGAAIPSFAVAVMLLAARRAFLFGSAKPDLALAVKRALLAVGIAGVYGALGFWLLEPREFGRNFHWWEAVARTLRVMLQVGDAGLSPRTVYAAWFLDSLDLISAAAFLYCGVTLFRPVAYRFRESDSDRELAGRITASYGRSGQDFFKLWPDKSIFFSSNRRCFIAYRVANNFALVLGDPVGPEEEIQPAIEQFVDFCQRRGWHVGFHQVHENRLGLYTRLGFHYFKIGDDAMVDLAGFSLSGSAMKEFRNTVNRLDRLGFSVQRLDPPIAGRRLAELKRVSDEWLAIPGNRERTFTLGRFDPNYVGATQVFAAIDPAGKAEAFLNLIPSYSSGLATVDLMRRGKDSINGIMDYLFAKVFLILKAEGVRHFSLGMAPGVDCGGSSSVKERAAAWLIRNFPYSFRAETLRRFKAKYAGHWEPLYSVYRSRWDLPRLALALQRMTENRKGLRRVA